MSGEVEVQRERELKFDVPAGWVLPDLSRLVPSGGRADVEHLRLESTYFDTPGHDLLAAGLTLRKRTGDADAGWQLKVPADEARREIRLPLGGRGVPEPMRTMTLGIRGRRALKPVAILGTEREVHRVLDADGQALVEVVLDRVTATREPAAAVTRRWTEVEVELLEGDEALLSGAARRLRKAGAVPAAVGSKLAHALDAPQPRRADPATLHGLIASYLDEQFAAIVSGDLALRRGEHRIHDSRVATRRYRSVLREFADVLDADRAARLDEELKWYAAALGAVRDCHVLRGEVAAALADVPSRLVLGPVGERIGATLDADEQRATAELDEAMRSRRYFALLTLLREWHVQLPMSSDARAAEVHRFLSTARRRVRKRRKRVPDAGPGLDDALHRVRKAAKRARYVAELARPALGKTARTAAKKAKKEQRRLGRRQDRVLAAEFFLRTSDVACARGENAFTFGVLHERVRASLPAR